ncbi:MAG: hypothetical protein H7A09_02755 [Oceanospirillaceae bacterium]|nr:hypothetical protein [Oceanospirillaceae bacterium]
MEQDIYLVLGAARQPSRDGFAGITQQERAQLARFSSAERSAAFYTGRKFARQLLQCYQPQAASLEFKCTPSGKPYLENAGHFSITHSADLVACVWSPRPVGLNLQQQRLQNYPAMTGELFCRGELQQLADLAPAQRRGFYYQVLSAKQALRKACGLDNRVPQADMAVHAYNHKMGLIHYAGIVWHVVWQAAGDAVFAVVSEEPFQLNTPVILPQQAVV